MMRTIQCSQSHSILASICIYLLDRSSGVCRWKQAVIKYGLLRHLVYSISEISTRESANGEITSTDCSHFCVFLCFLVRLEQKVAPFALLFFDSYIHSFTGSICKCATEWWCDTIGHTCDPLLTCCYRPPYAEEVWERTPCTDMGVQWHRPWAVWCSRQRLRLTLALRLRLILILKFTL